ncbi:MFS transporter [Streptomyces sp. NBC_01794]|uniref:MFS transporter n=1 Tax=Streptomyces sp. NBC_01794 TaxID=2975942 RepID=UPI0030868C88|nr:MFS transporter [Streptomyces sp. NBC_01794]WSB05145.1 MFS transporter [Streptomyces sp. NBC_01794]
MASSDTATASATYREVFDNPVFRLLFGANLAAVLGTTLRMVALSLLVYDVTGSAFLTALTYGIAFAPQAIGGVLLGALPDRICPRALIAAGHGLECAVGAVVALAPLPIGASLLLVAVLGALTPAFRGATSKVIAQSLHGDAYVLGRSLVGLTMSGGQLVALAAGGLLVAWLGVPGALLTGALCHLAAAIVVRIGLPNLPVEGRAAGTVVRQSWSGTRRLLKERAMRSLFLAQWLPPAFIAGVESLILPYARVRGFSVTAASLLLACLPVGMIVGDLLMGRLVRPATRVRLVMPLMTLVGIAFVPLLFEPPTLVCAALLAVSGVGNAYMLGVQGRFRDVAPTALLGQAFALLGTGLMALQGVGPMVLGALAQWTGYGAAVGAAGVATVATAAALWPGWSRSTAPLMNGAAQTPDK